MVPDKLLAFYNRVAALGEKEKATDTIYLDLCKAFGTVSHNMLFSKMGFRDGPVELAG